MAEEMMSGYTELAQSYITHARVWLGEGFCMFMRVEDETLLLFQ